MNPLSIKIHALLFAEGGGVSFSSLKRQLSCDDAALHAALGELSAQLTGSGLTLVTSDTEAVLAIADLARDVVVSKAREEISRDIGDAGLEVLAIVLYEGASTRADIDYIRGVNSSSTVRNLLTRGLIERAGNPEDAREYIYRPTTELLAHLGAPGRESLPDYATIARELSTFKTEAPDGPFSSSKPLKKDHESGPITEPTA